MSMVDFSRGELAPTMRYRSDLEVYHKGVEILERFLPTARGGLVRGPGCQVLELLPPSQSPPAVRLFSVGSTGLDQDIPAVGSGVTVNIGTAIYDTEFRTKPISKNKEMDILLSFTEYGDADDIIAYWVNPPDKKPVFYQRIWNYNSGVYSYPAIDFEDTRDVRVAQVENNVYIIARTQIYSIEWDKNKITPTWDPAVTYNEREVVIRTVGNAVYHFECLVGPQLNQDPATNEGKEYWRVTYPSYLSWKIISPRVGYEFLKGIGEDSDPYEWLSNIDWGSDTSYVKGDVVTVSGIVYECKKNHTSGTVSAGDTPDGTNWESYDTASHPVQKDAEGKPTIKQDDKVYRRSSFAFREEAVPREMVVHHNRLIFAGSAIRPSTIHGSEVYHYMNFGAGINDDEPWIVTLSGDRVGRILWMTVTDQLYIGTSGGIFAVSGVLTPNQFQLRKVTNHAASEVHAVAAAGSVIFFHKDRMTLREVEYADQAENYRAFDLTIFSNHLFTEFKALKMVVINDPSIIIWILRQDGTLVSLSYEKTVQMYAFARHEFHGKIYDIAAGKENELFAIMELEDANVRQLVRIGDNDITYGYEILEDIHLDGLLSLVNIDNSNLFATQILNETMRQWYLENGISYVTTMLTRTAKIDASGTTALRGDLKDCGLTHFSRVDSLDLSNTALSGDVPSNLTNLMASATPNASYPITFNLENTLVSKWKITKIPNTWKMINLKGTRFLVGDVKAIIDSVILSENDSHRTGTLDIRSTTTPKTRILDANNALQSAINLKAKGWTVLIDNDDGWDAESVQFNGNGHGAGSPPDALPCLYNGTILIPAISSSFAKAGFDFKGWSDTANGNPNWTEGTSYTKTSQGIKVFYAIWVAANKVTYSGNGGAGGVVPVDENTYNPGNTIIVKAGIPEKLGHTFNGWAFNTAGTGTKMFASDAITMGSGPITLYATWQIVRYRVSFNNSGAQKGTSPFATTVEYGSVYTIPAPQVSMHKSTSIENYDTWQKFSKWAVNDGTGNAYSPGYAFTMPAHEVNFFAEFEDYSLGDEGPNGGTIVYDSGSYATKKFSGYLNQRGIPSLVLSEYGGDPLTYTWRYMEMLNNNTSSPRPYEICTTAYASENGAKWWLPIDTYLSIALTGSHMPNKGTDSYWVGDARVEIGWGVYKRYYQYMEPGVGIIKETTDKNSLFNMRFARGI